MALTCTLEHRKRAAIARSGELALLHKCLVSMGMTPADRARVSVKKKKLSLQELITQSSECDGQDEKAS